MGQRPGPRDLCRRGARLGGDGLHLVGDRQVTPEVLARCPFLHTAAPPPRRSTARDVFPDGDNRIRGCVARLRALAGPDPGPDVPDLARLVGGLLLRSPDFAGPWERYEVTGRKHATRAFQHPRVGTVTLVFQGTALEGTPATAWASAPPNPAPPTAAPCSRSTWPRTPAGHGRPGSGGDL
ncbi:hypothetical protein [Streptomyces sp. NPDC058632]|uniref:MmyB family transcriptional regulator n=1 Tax=Streptomyces sp. NPDC058632 TaxID=3346567 RepID=UPI0036598E23